MPLILLILFISMSNIYRYMYICMHSSCMMCCRFERGVFLFEILSISHISICNLFTMV